MKLLYIVIKCKCTNDYNIYKKVFVIIKTFFYFMTKKINCEFFRKIFLLTIIKENNI